MTENNYSSHSAMSIKEILEELPKLTPEERQYVREWLVRADRGTGQMSRPMAGCEKEEGTEGHKDHEDPIVSAARRVPGYRLPSK